MTEFHVSFPGLGLNNLVIKRVAFSLNFFGHTLDIYWYGILIAVAFILGLILSLRDSKNTKLSQDDVFDAFLWTIPFSIIGARLYFVIFKWSEFSDNLLKILDIRDGGLAFYGGVIGGIIALLFCAKHKGLPLSTYLDYFPPYLALGQAIGRWGNFFNQEAFGGHTNMPWGMISEGTVGYLSAIKYPYAQSPVHPTFLYESLGNLLIYVILMRIRRKSEIKLETMCWYLASYGILRFFTEGLRTDSLYLPGSNLRVSQLLSALMVLGSMAYLIYAYSHKSTKETECTDQN